MNLLATICFSLFFIYLGLGLYVISREPGSALNRIFFALTASSAVWVGAFSLVFFQNSPQWEWFWFKISSLGWISLAAFCLHFTLVLTGLDRLMKKWLMVLLYIPAAAEIIMMNTVIEPALFFETGTFTMTGFISPWQQWFWIMHALYYFSYSMIMFIIVARWGNHSVFLREKRQAKIILVSGLLVVISFVFEYTILPVAGYSLPWLVILTGLIWAGSMLYAMTKYKLMDLSPALAIDDILARVTDMVLLLDRSGHITMANNKAADILGYSMDELQHMTLMKIIPNVKLYDMIMAKQKDLTMELEVAYQTARAEIIPVKAYFSSITDETGDIVGTLAIGQDLRMTKQLEYRIEEKNRIELALRQNEAKYKQMEDKLRYLSMHDSMTGLYNRAYFVEELNRLESGRFEPASIIMCDLDNLKEINDSIGHDAGDKIIIIAAKLIKSCFRANDVLARLGGDEFVIVIPNSNEVVCRHLIDKIQSAVEKHNQTSPDIIEISAGFAVRSSTMQTMNEVFKLADQAMYADKAKRKKTASVTKIDGTNK